uniref:Uncharacterized protein n=1 Tax=Arundo donax TaxID=35708 RepID=A0A0A9GNY1_ARUDO
MVCTLVLLPPVKLHAFPIHIPISCYYYFSTQYWHVKTEFLVYSSLCISYNLQHHLSS